MHTWNAFDQATRTLPVPRSRPPVETINPVVVPSPGTADRTPTTRAPGRMRAAFAEWREVRRINRAYRRERREFEARSARTRTRSVRRRSRRLAAQSGN